MVRELAPTATVTITGRPRDGGRDEEIAIVLADGQHRRIDFEDWPEGSGRRGWIAYNPASTRELPLDTAADLPRVVGAYLQEPAPDRRRA